jgi:putative ABC transport system permease protein
MMALDRKLLRDLWRTRAQVASIALVLAGGVLCVVSIRGTASSLVRARADYYTVGHFADLFATLTRAPEAVRARRVRVEIGHVGTGVAEVLGGMHAGERVVVFPPDVLRDGMRVRSAA